MVLSDAGGHPSTPVTPGTVAAPPPANVEAMGTDQLLSEARKAMNDQRYLAPAGNNAFEFYLKALEREPGNAVATDALRETFPFAASAAEQAINARNFNEAQREIDLLAKADPANFTLTILRSKLDAQQKLASQQQAQDQQKAAQLAAQKAAAEARQMANIEAGTHDASWVDQQQLEQQRAQTAQAKPAAPATPAATAGETADAVLLKGAEPVFPTAALRSGQAGWVRVGFTITPEGRTADIHVIDAQPRRVFDRAAMDAVAHYRFKPAMKNGAAVASNTEQKIEFNTGR
jgi:protein TonB